ncbi:glycosyltransferase family 4 protein [Vibrio breoganii]
MKVLFIGPNSLPVTGQSLSFSELYSSYESKLKCCLNYPGNNILLSLVFVMKLFFSLVGSRYDRLYLTTSRTKVGLIRDSIVVVLFKVFNPNSKIVNHLHGADFLDFRNSLSRIWTNYLDFVYNKIDHSIVLTNSMLSQYADYPEMKISVLSNFYSVKEGNAVVCREAKNEVNLLFLSNLIATKGIFELLESIVDLRRGGVNAKLIIAGYSFLNSVDQERFDQYIADYDYIQYNGPVSGDEKELLLSNACIFCLPTYYPTEAQPISILEALAKGCVIVTTTHNYIPDFISSRNGRLVEPKSSSAIYEAINNLLMCPVELSDISAFNIRYARDNFSKQKIVEEFNIILHDN